MPWLQVIFTTDRERVPLIETALDAAGALAVTLGDAGDEPQLEPAPGATPLWRELRITALFEDDADSRARAKKLAVLLSDQLAAPPLFERLEDQPWERAWMVDFAPTRFGKRLWVCPRGQSPEEDDAAIVELDPGLAFGTGHHPTTALCLRWLDHMDLCGRTLVDYGCGSGILAIAALKLGADRAIAIDYDPQALEATAANATENRVTDRLTICPPEVQPGQASDLLVANILAGPLVELAPRLATLVRPSGYLALSGLLRDQITDVSVAYRPYFDLDDPLIEEDWALLSGRRKSGE